VPCSARESPFSVGVALVRHVRFRGPQVLTLFAISAGSEVGSASMTTKVPMKNNMLLAHKEPFP